MIALVALLILVPLAVDLFFLKESVEALDGDISNSPAESPQPLHEGSSDMLDMVDAAPEETPASPAVTAPPPPEPAPVPAEAAELVFAPEASEEADLTFAPALHWLAPEADDSAEPESDAEETAQHPELAAALWQKRA